MGKFNFDQNNSVKKFDSFNPIEIKQSNRGISRIERPILSMNKTTIRVGAYLGEQLIHEGYKYARFMLSKNMLAIQFLHEQEPNCVKFRTNKHQGAALTASFTSVANYLMESTDLVNLNVYNYQFYINHDEKNVYYIELDKPWTKIKKKKS